MSVHDPEPKIPNDDNGKGLRMIGWFLLLWAGATLIWIPSHTRWTNWMSWVGWLCFVGGIAFVGIGYYVQSKTPSEIELDERTHDLMVTTHEGYQNDEPAIEDGPGRYPTPRRTA